MDFVEQVKSSVDIVRLVGEYVRLKKAGNRYVGLCPFHTEKSPSFSVNAAEGLFYCFGCQASGDAITFVRETQHLDFVSSVEQAKLVTTYAYTMVGLQAGVDLVLWRLAPSLDALEESAAAALRCGMGTWMTVKESFLGLIQPSQYVKKPTPQEQSLFSGEVAMLEAAAERGWIDRKSAALEMLTAIVRAGAGIVITYLAADAARWLQEDAP